MVKRVNAFCLVGLLVIAGLNANSMESLQGPTFSNSSDIEVKLSVINEGKSQELLRAFPAHQFIAMPYELKVKLIYVIAGERRYELDEEEYLAQSTGLLQRRQLWIFDGSHLCVRNINQIRGNLYNQLTCEGIGASR